MDTLMRKDISVSPREAVFLEKFLASNGFENVTVLYNENGAYLAFHDSADYLLFVITDVLSKIRTDDIYPDIDVDFIIRLEKRLKTFSKSDEALLRALLKET